MQKQCSVCKLIKPINEFSPRGQGKFNSSCKSCKNIASAKYRKRAYVKQYQKDYQKEYRANHNSKDSMHGYHLKRKFAISSQEYTNLLDKQRGVCALCLEKSINKRLAVDHDHVTGKIRGLLCENCNRGLGMFKDKLRTFYRAIIYLS